MFHCVTEEVERKTHIMSVSLSRMFFFFFYGKFLFFLLFIFFVPYDMLCYTFSSTSSTPKQHRLFLSCLFFFFRSFSCNFVFLLVMAMNGPTPPTTPQIQSAPLAIDDVLSLWYLKLPPPPSSSVPHLYRKSHIYFRIESAAVRSQNFFFYV